MSAQKGPVGMVPRHQPTTAAGVNPTAAAAAASSSSGPSLPKANDIAAVLRGVQDAMAKTSEETNTLLAQLVQATKELSAHPATVTAEDQLQNLDDRQNLTEAVLFSLDLLNYAGVGEDQAKKRIALKLEDHRAKMRTLFNRAEDDKIKLFPASDDQAEDED